MEKKEPTETQPEGGLSRRRFVKQVAAWGAAALALYAPPRLRALALAADQSGAGKTRKAPGSDKLLLLDKNPAADKDPGEKDPASDKSSEKDPADDKDPGEKSLDTGSNSDSEQPGPPRRYAGLGPDEWGPDA
jgi:hypothetical protein